VNLRRRFIAPQVVVVAEAIAFADDPIGMTQIVLDILVKLLTLLVKKRRRADENHL